MGRSAKGSSYEREICRMLSEWWSGGRRDDIFWRSSASGGRATVRSKSGKATFGQYGDIAAVDPVGQPLTRTLCFELKRGYTKYSFADAIDRTPHAAQMPWEAFVEQASTSATAAGALAWVLVQRRDKREALVFFPHALYTALRDVGAFAEKPTPFIVMQVAPRIGKGERVPMRVTVMSLADFLWLVRPKHVIELANSRTS